MHRASSYNMYKNQQDAQDSCDWTLFSIRCSICSGLCQSIIRSKFYELYIAFGIRHTTARRMVAVKHIVNKSSNITKVVYLVGLHR